MISHPAFVGTTLSLSLLSTLINASPLQPRIEPVVSEPKVVAGYTAQGCYTEATSGRALSANAYYDDQLTVEKCAATCSKFTFFGVEYGRECYCGNGLNEGSVSASDDQCSFNCPGDSTEKCGAGNRLNVYEKLVTEPVVTGTTPTPTPSVYQAEGCYTEATSGRALTGKTFYDDAMTTAKCASACAGFDFFGLEYYRECYCGNKLQSGSVAAPSGECYHPCTGDNSEICGGDNRLNLYSFGTGTTATPPVSTPKGYAFDGCFTEATQGRALTGSVYYDDQMTVDKCSAVCKGFTLFGVEYGRECYCGNSLQAGSDMVSETQCNYPCPGNDAQFCGAGNRLDVYHFGVATSTISSSPSSATSTQASSATSSSSVTTSTEASTESTSSEALTTSSTTSSSTEMSTTSSETSTSSIATTSVSSTSSIASSTSIAPSTSSTSSTASSTSVDPTTSSTPSTITPTPSSTSSSIIPTGTSSSSTSSVCVPSPSQVVVNPSFEIAPFTQPWSFTGTGQSSVQSNTNNAYQSYDGTHFAVLYGRTASTVGLSQTISNLVAGRAYTLQYYYNVPATSPTSQCVFTVKTGNQQIDQFSSPLRATSTYSRRLATYTNTQTGSVVLTFVLTCPTLGAATRVTFSLDAITLTSDVNGCS